jgi:hypothetical protein
MNILQAVVRTLRQPDGTYPLPDGNRIVPAVSPGGLPVWQVTFERNGIAWWLSNSLIWVCSLTWNPNKDWSRDHSFATPEEAYFAWLQWADGREEG